MRFKHLTLQGYKSFAAKTDFLFPTGITAVVGPNGSGKSNIADGIQWALGEQSMRALRGKSTADMIFAGGQRRARAGMAEVSLTLDNSDGWLPIEFTEVTITRRAYRSGNNEYLINGARVRLRDIGEMLAESGLSQRAYTVIGQGLVDAALALQPRERRTLFEEAAGISLYRTRREDALRRLDETQHNLERVHDILGEIVPRLHRLEGEVQRVEEHRRLTAHLERLQRTWHGYQWGRQQASLNRALERASALESVMTKRQSRASSLGEQLIKQRQRESTLRTGLRDWHRQSAGLHDRTNEVQREVAVTEERTRLLKARREELVAELEPLNNQREAQAKRVAQADTKLKQMEDRVAECGERLTDLEQKWMEARKQAEEPSDLRRQAEQELRVLRAESQRLSHTLLETRAEAVRLSAEKEALSRLRAGQAAYDVGVRAVLEADIEGVVGSLLTLVEIDAEWRQAIEAALGPDVQAIVVDRASIAEKVGRVLQSAAGRATLLPLDTLQPPPPLPPAARPAADFVSCRAEVRPAVEALLGAVALCDNLAAARALLPAMPSGGRCVTPAGVVLRADGAITLGEASAITVATEKDVGTESAPDVVQIERRCQDIEHEQRMHAERAAALEAEIVELSQRAAAADEETSRLEEALAQSRTEVAVAEEALRSQQVALQRETALLDRLQAQVAARQQRAEELEAEQAAITARADDLRVEAAQLETDLSQVRKRIQPAEDELALLGEEQTATEEQERQARSRARDAEARHGRAQLEVDRCRDELKLLVRRIEEDLGLVELELADSVTAQSPLPLRPVVSQLPIVEELPEGLEAEIQLLKARVRRMGGVNPNAPEDYAQVKERHGFLSEQIADLEKASEQLREVVAELDELMETAFQETFDAVAARFSETFEALFQGGAAHLELTEPDDLMNTGVDIVARPPGKRAQRLALLSGGERALTATALLFALLRVSPTPFCVLDEVDAMLDETNVGRFRALLEELSRQTQFIVITHNRVTIEAADTIYGVSMGADGISQVVSLKLEECK